MKDEELTKALRGMGLHRAVVIADRIETLTAQLESTLKDRALIIAERDRTFALMLARAEKAETENARLRKSLTGIKRAAAHRMQNDRRDLHSYYFHTADAALNTGKEPMREERFAQCDIFEEEPSHE